MDLISHRQRLGHSAEGHRGGQLGLLALAAAVGILAGAAAGAVPAASSSSGRAIMLAFGLLGLVLLAILTDPRRVCMGLVLLDLPFQWDVNLGYRTDIADLAGLPGFNVSLMTLALAGLYAVWIAELLVRAEGSARPRLRPAAIPFSLLCVLALSVVVARDQTVAGFEIVLIAQMFALFVYVSSCVRTRQEVRFIVILLLLGLLLNALISLASHVMPGGLHVPGTATYRAPVADGPVGSRLMGIFGSPNGAGAYFAFWLALAISLCVSPVDRGIRRLAVIAAVPTLIGLTLTLSRGAWVAFVVSVLVLMLGLRGQRSSRVSAPAVVTVIVCAVLLLVPLQGVINSRVTGNDAGAAASRVPLLHLAGDMIGDHPLLGVGANNFGIALPDYAGPAYSADWLAVVHNKYLLIWAEAGLAALAALLAFLWVTIRRGWRARRAHDALLSAVALGLAAAVAGHAVHMNFEIFKSRPMNESLWLAAALIAAPALASKNRRAASADQ